MPEFAPVISVSSLDGTNGFRLDGEAAADESGKIVAGAGDVNGDGFADLLIGAPYSDIGGSNRGLAYVVFGAVSNPAGQSLAARVAAGTAYRFQGEAVQDRAGWSIASAGDTNGDGFDDLLIGARYAGPDGGVKRSATYLVFGGTAKLEALDVADGANDGNIQLTLLTPATGYRFDGVADNDIAGYSVSGAGNINGDGFEDIIIGAFGAGSDGESYVVFGGAANLADLDDDDGVADARIDLAQISAGQGSRLFDGTSFFSGDGSGFSVAGAGDVNGDGFADVIVGAINADPNGTNTNEGAAFLVFGRADMPAAINLTFEGGTRLDGMAAGDLTGRSVNTAGDINGDGFDDVIIGAADADPAGDNSGSAYVVFGKAFWGDSLDLASLNGTNGFRLDGVKASDKAGSSVSAAGDVNGDGFADIAISAPFLQQLNVFGALFVVFGKATGFAPVIDLGSLDGNDGFVVANAKGRVAGPAGDVNGDGFDDIVVGAYQSDYGGDDSGSTYVVYGHRALSDVNRVGTDFDDRINGGVGDDTISGLSGNDTLIGWEGNDTVSGGSGADVFLASLGDDTADGGSSSDSFDFINIAGGGVSVNLTTGTAILPNADSSLAFTNIERLLGTASGDQFTGNARVNVLSGRSGSDVLSGLGNNDVLSGHNGNDTLGGGAGSDLLIGGLGKDSLTGGTGADRFDFNLVTESGLSAATSDTISGFQQGVDVFDLATIDANTTVGGNQAFTFIGAAAFTAPGQVRAVNFSGNTFVQASNDGDTSADMAFTITGPFTLTLADFLL